MANYRRHDSKEHLVSSREPGYYVYSQDIEPDYDSGDESNSSSPQESIISVYDSEIAKDRARERVRREIPERDYSESPRRPPQRQMDRQFQQEPRRRGETDRGLGHRTDRYYHEDPDHFESESNSRRSERMKENFENIPESSRQGRPTWKEAARRTRDSKTDLEEFDQRRNPQKRRSVDLERGRVYSDEDDGYQRERQQRSQRQNLQEKQRHDDSDDNQYYEDRQHKGHQTRQTPQHQQRHGTHPQHSNYRRSPERYSESSDDDVSQYSERYDNRRDNTKSGMQRQQRPYDNYPSDRANRDPRRFAGQGLGKHPSRMEDNRTAKAGDYDENISYRKYSIPEPGGSSESMEDNSSEQSEFSQQDKVDGSNVRNRVASNLSAGKAPSFNMRDAVNIKMQLEKQPREIVTEDEVDSSAVLRRRKCWGGRCIKKDCNIHRREHHSQNTEDGEDTDENKLQAKTDNQFYLKAEAFRKKTWDRIKERLNENLSRLAVWHHAIKAIEGRFGTSIASYFIFIRKLLLLNLVIAAIMILFVVIPQAFHPEFAINNAEDEVQKCSVWYQDFRKNYSNEFEHHVLGFLQGTGWMESTLMFIGMYDIGNIQLLPSFNYDIPLAYMLSTIAFLLVSLIFMLKSVAHGFKANAVTTEGQLFNYCNSVFCAWDFCITKEKAANLRKDIIKSDLKGCLKAEEEKKKRKERTTKEKAILYTKRFAINILILSMLGGALFAIYMVSIEMEKILNSLTETYGIQNLIKKTDLFIEYAPSLTITLCNVVLPLTFNVLAQFEEYSPAFLVKITLGRTVVLRLTSIFMLLVSFDKMITSEKNDYCTELCVTSKNCTNKAISQCWETFVGQQLYKLVLLDFVTAMVSIFIVGTLKKLVYNKFGWRILEEQFDIAKNVLDLVYSQTLCWLGAFFSPLLPVVCILKCIILFYAKKFHIRLNCNLSSTTSYRASKSNSFFMIILLVSFGSLVLIPTVYTMSSLHPSRGCSPFRINTDTLWETITKSVDSWSEKSKFFGNALNFIGSAGFAIPIIVIILLYIYYNYTKAAAYTKMASRLREHLQTESRDKQFLLKRLNELSLRMRANLLRQESGLHRRSVASPM